MNEAWTSPHMWRLSGSLSALRRTIDESRTVVAASELLRFERNCERLARRRNHLVTEAQRIAANGTSGDRDALTQQLLKFYRDIGELERQVEQKRVRI